MVPKQQPSEKGNCNIKIKINFLHSNKIHSGWLSGKWEMDLKVVVESLHSHKEAIQ